MTVESPMPIYQITIGLHGSGKENYSDMTNDAALRLQQQ
jgi:hypothetical protein